MKFAYSLKKFSILLLAMFSFLFFFQTVPIEAVKKPLPATGKKVKSILDTKVAPVDNQTDKKNPTKKTSISDKFSAKPEQTKIQYISVSYTDYAIAPGKIGAQMFRLSYQFPLFTYNDISFRLDPGANFSFFKYKFHSPDHSNSGRISVGNMLFAQVGVLAYYTRFFSTGIHYFLPLADGVFVKRNLTFDKNRLKYKPTSFSIFSVTGHYQIKPQILMGVTAEYNIGLKFSQQTGFGIHFIYLF